MSTPNSYAPELDHLSQARIVAVPDDIDKLTDSGHNYTEAHLILGLRIPQVPELPDEIDKLADAGFNYYQARQIVGDIATKGANL